MIIFILCLDTSGQIIILHRYVLFILIYGVMWILIRSVLHILAYSVGLYLLNYYNLLWWIHFDFNVSTWQDIVKVYLLLGFIFWVCFAIIKKILNIFAFPFQFLTFWLIGFVINIVIFYVCQILINTYLNGIQMQITSFTGLVIVSFLLSMIVSCIYWILKKII